MSNRKKNKNNGDNTSRIRGNLYQVQYAVLLFLDENTKEIMNEGSINGKSFEDVTIKTYDNKKNTYQFKYHHINTNKKESFCVSGDIFKTLYNENNVDFDNIYYISSSGFYDNFDIFIKDNGNVIYEKILDLYENEITEEDKIKFNNENNKKTLSKEKIKFIDFYHKIIKHENKDNIINYLNKVQKKEGIKTYSELKNKIYDEITKNFKIDINDKILLFCIRYKIYDIFDDILFNKNERYINVKDEFKKIEEELEIKKYTKKNIDINKKLSLLFNFDYENENNSINIDFIEEEIKLMLELELLNSDDMQSILNNLNKMYKNINNTIYKEKIENYYNLLKKQFCKIILNKYKKYRKNVTDDEYEGIYKSLTTYYNHSIKHEINPLRASINFLFK